MSLTYPAIIEQLGASMTAAAERMSEQQARITELERDLADCESSHEALDTKLELLRLKAKDWAENLRGEGYDQFADEIEEAFR